MAQVRISDIKVMVIDGQGIGGPWNLIRVETNEGVWGLGESYWGVGIRAVIDGLLKPLLIGEDPRDVDRLYTALTFRLGGAHTLSGLAMAAISGTEIALWDLFGKLAGLPAYRLLGGGFRDRIRAYCTGTPMGLEDAAKCGEYAAKVRAHGYTAIKAIDADTLWERYDPHLRQPGHERFSRSLTGEDLRLAERILANLRDAFGETFDIAVHCHWALDLSDAVRLCERIAPYHPRWLEDPLPIPFSPAWVELARATRVPIATGENLYSRHEFRPFIEEHAVSMVNVDVPKAGGLLEAKRIADLADLHYLSTSFHNPASPVGTIASVQAAAAIRGFGVIECFLRDGQWWQDLIVHDGPIVRDGFIAVPEGPGLGIELNPDVVRAHLAPGETYWGP